MEPIHTNSPVIARALEYTQEVKRKRELEQQVAAKSENRSDEQHPNRVFFSQEAQIKLSEEKSHDVNRVEAVRVENKIKAAEQYSEAISQEIKKGAAVKSDDRKLRNERDQAARAKTAAAGKLLAAGNKEIQESADATRKSKADESAKAISVRDEAVKNIQERSIMVAAVRDINRRIKENDDMAEKTNTATTTKNKEDHQRSIDVTVENLKVDKARTARVRTETAKAVKMYGHVGKLP